MTARLAVVYAARGPSSPARLRMRYLADELSRRGVEVEVVELPQTRLAYAKRMRVVAEKALFSVPPAYVAATVNSRLTFADVRDPWDVYVKESNTLKRLLALPLVQKYLDALRRSDLVVATTESIAKHYERLLKKKVYVIENGTDTELLKCERSEREDRVLVIADFRNPYLPLDPLREACRAEGVELKLVGPGSERLGGIGQVSYERLPSVACDSKVGAVPRPWEGSTYRMTVPLKTYDYMALGLCIFAYGPPSSELQRLLERYDIGVYVSEKRYVREGLRECLRDAEAMGKRAREVAELHFDRRELSKRYADLLAKFL
ncbi:MAG: glycosyltransferase family 4 protein [Crenarchaeota archaeon]|nr:glycosyltransferase family 4 protein [Thermoproteota archaeon]